MREHAGIARRDGVPTLDFLFLVYQDGGDWVGRSIRSGHVSESSTFRGAVDGLTAAIDEAINVAKNRGFSAEQWYAAQQLDEIKYVRMFLDVIGHENPERQRTKAPSGSFFLNASVAKVAA